VFILPLDQVAVKVPSGLTTGSADLVMKDLTREIEVMAALDHPHIVKLYGITHTHHFVHSLKTVMMVVMEFVEGGSLSSHLEKIKVSHCSCMPVGD
jgi:serine/threonine protein kinase